MFSTVFDENLDKFLYGETCTPNSFGYKREGKGIILNSQSGKLKISGFAVSTLLMGTIFLTSSGFSTYSTAYGREHLKPGYTSKVTKLDERGRQDLVKKITKFREDFKLSQDDLAKLLHLSTSTLSKLERGEHYPDATNLAKYNSFVDFSEYLNQKLNGKKYTIRQLFSTKSSIFGDMTPIEFSHAVGEEGLNEVIGSFKRLYG